MQSQTQTQTQAQIQAQIQAQVQPLLPGLAQDLHADSAYSNPTALDVLQMATEILAAARQTPNAGYLLESLDPNVRRMLRQSILAQLEGAYREVETNSTPNWWQITLNNGAIVRVAHGKAID